MNKLLSALTLAAFAALTLPAQAASHVGAAPMGKASEPAMMKKEEKKDAMMKKDAMKKDAMTRKPE